MKAIVKEFKNRVSMFEFIANNANTLQVYKTAKCELTNTFLVSFIKL